MTALAKKVGLVAAALSVLLAAGSARADFQLALGTKWDPINYTRPVGLSNGAGFTPMAGWQNTALNNYLGFMFAGGQFGFQLSLDLAWGNSALSVTPQGGGTTTGDQSYTQFGFALGGKLHLNKPKAARVSPYVYFDIYKYFASMSTSDTNVTNQQAGYQAGLLSPFGFHVAFGAEYFFSRAFSIGAEIFGLKFGYASGDMNENNVHTSANWKFITLYTGITLNYRFIFEGSVKIRVADEEEEVTTQRPKRRVPPAEQPETSPESVD